MINDIDIALMSESELESGLDGDTSIEQDVRLLIRVAWLRPRMFRAFIRGCLTRLMEDHQPTCAWVAAAALFMLLLASVICIAWVCYPYFWLRNAWGKL